MLAKSSSLRWGLAVMLMLSSIISFAQRVVTGTVTGADNQPASGATITVTGTNVATQTDATGKFSISVPQNRNSLTVSYVGAELQTIALAGRTAVNVALKAATSSLSEVVVTGYGTQRKKDVTGSVSVVNVANLRQQPVGTGAEALQGQASGVTIITSGQPGAASDLRIRGITA
ncbi:MAG: carboxypeptidase-like regulatory domain-containing protein, partial [Bacteroidota bacterium]|nr:carboxypeptidase-like regulatory domain-containing protein [Bacteroidota bacterium]